MRIPVRHDLTGFNVPSFGHGYHRTIGNLVTLALTAVLVDYAELAGTGYRYEVAIGLLDHLDMMQAHRALVFHHDISRRGCTTGRTADVEGAHGQLGAWLADRLRRNHADGLALVDDMPAGQVSAVASGTDAVGVFTGNNRAHLDFIHADFFQLVHPLFVQEGACRYNHLVGTGALHVDGGYTAEYELIQRHDHITAFDNRLHNQSALGAAVVIDHDQVLRNVDQPARKITRVGGFQGGIGQTLARAMGGDEVLQHIQSLAEIRRNRRLDDRAVRLGHEAAHTRKLADLGR